MLTKILLILGVIVMVVLAVRNRGTGSTPERTSNGQQAASSPARITAWVLIGVIIAITLGYSALQWRDSTEVVTVKVVNSNTGKSVSYQVSRDQVGDRRFRTVDGRTIVLAEVERIEVGSPP